MIPRPDPSVLAEYTRSGFTEGVHVGHAVVVDASGSIVSEWGDSAHVVFPRSSNKPAQATAMVACGLHLPDPLLALAASSHSGEDYHLDGVLDILARAGLTEDALQTPADFPLDPVERDAWIRAGDGPRPLAMNCSGKHAAMLLTCVVNGWSVDDYLDPGHPVQVEVRRELERLSGERVDHVGVDGCGAPVLSLTVAGLARVLSRCATAEPASPAGRVATAMRAFPGHVGGTRRDVTAFMRTVPGLIAKDGAEGVYAAALPDGTGVAVKVEDGSDRARQVALAAILVTVGVPARDLVDLLTLPLSGGSEVVGLVRSPLA